MCNQQGFYFLIFNKDTIPKPAPYAIVGEENKVIYSQDRYSDEMLLNVARYKGSTGVVNLSWAVTNGPNTPASFTVAPVSGQLEFIESQWNSSIRLEFHSIPDTDQQFEISVMLLNVSGGGRLGNVTTVKIVFPSNVGDDELHPKVEDGEVTTPIEKDDSNMTDIMLIIVLPCVSGALLIIGITAATIFLCKRTRKRYNV